MGIGWFWGWYYRMRDGELVVRVAGGAVVGEWPAEVGSSS